MVQSHHHGATRRFFPTYKSNAKDLGGFFRWPKSVHAKTVGCALISAIFSKAARAGLESVAHSTVFPVGAVAHAFNQRGSWRIFGQAPCGERITRVALHIGVRPANEVRLGGLQARQNAVPVSLVHIDAHHLQPYPCGAAWISCSTRAVSSLLPFSTTVGRKVAAVRLACCAASTTRCTSAGRVRPSLYA